MDVGYFRHYYFHYYHRYYYCFYHQCQWLIEFFPLRFALNFLNLLVGKHYAQSTSLRVQGTILFLYAFLLPTYNGLYFLIEALYIAIEMTRENIRGYKKT